MMSRASRSVQKYLGEARARAVARRRLPAWLAVLMPFTVLFFVFGVTVGGMFAAGRIHHWLHPEITWRAISDAARFLIFAGAFVAALAPGVILATWLCGLC